MISRIQFEANQQNALLSTGPKDTASTKYNAIKHGLCAKAILINGESQEEFEELSSGILEELGPEGIIEQELVDQIVLCFWRLRRVPRAEKAIGDHATGLDCHVRWDKVFVNDSVNEIMRHEARITKQLSNVMGAFYRLQATRLAQEKSPAAG